MLLAIVPVLMIVIGALTYGLSTNGKVSEIGRLVLFAGLLAFALSYAGSVVSLGRALR
jgi:Na+/phosphate symporter